MIFFFLFCVNFRSKDTQEQFDRFLGTISYYSELAVQIILTTPVWGPVTQMAPKKKKTSYFSHFLLVSSSTAGNFDFICLDFEILVYERSGFVKNNGVQLIPACFYLYLSKMTYSIVQNLCVLKGK